MRQDNYKAWKISVPSTPSVTDFLQFAVLAPSSHNSQPWSFHVEGNILSVSLAESRRLPISDRNDRQAIISIGCALTNTELAADFYGYTCAIEGIAENPFHVSLKLTGTGHPHKEAESHLASSIPKRVTNRNPHTTQALDEATLSAIRSLASEGVRISIITKRDLIEKLGVIAVDAAIDALEDDGFRRELSNYLKPNSTKSFLGMPGFGLGFPAPVAAIAPALIKFFNMEKLARKQNLELFAHTTGLIVLSTSSDTAGDWLSVGRVYEHIALLAARSGMATAPWAAAIQIGEHYRKIQQALKTTDRPQLLARIGYPTMPVGHSPRLPASAVLH